MEWIDQLRGTVVGLDTAPLIYFIEEHPRYLPIVRPFFEALDGGECTAVTSTLTIAEVLVHPLRNGDIELASRYRDILMGAKGLILTPVSAEVAETAARIRGEFNVRTPDAIQLATTMQSGAQYFLTNDLKLHELPGMQLIVLERVLGTTSP